MWCMSGSAPGASNSGSTPGNTKETRKNCPFESCFDLFRQPSLADEKRLFASTASTWTHGASWMVDGWNRSEVCAISFWQNLMASGLEWQWQWPWPSISTYYLVFNLFQLVSPCLASAASAPKKTLENLSHWNVFECFDPR